MTGVPDRVERTTAAAMHALTPISRHGYAPWE
jgi:hypothetical protein